MTRGCGQCCWQTKFWSGYFAAYIPYNSIIFLYYMCLRSKESSWAKKRCDVLDETLGLYEICLQVTQQRKMVCVWQSCVWKMACVKVVCVCVNPAITCRHKLIYIRTLTLEVKAEQGATAPFISPWPTKLLMFGEDMQSDQLHVPANRTVDFCSSMTLFALRKNFTFHTVSSIACTSSFWVSELVREPSCIALTWHRACFGSQVSKEFKARTRSFTWRSISNPIQQCVLGARQIMPTPSQGFVPA